MNKFGEKIINCLVTGNWRHLYVSKEAGQSQMGRYREQLFHDQSVFG
jgi:hypothetical protein